MPVYEYRCGGCGHRFELRQGFEDPPQAPCPRCQGQAHRVFYPVPIIYKGSGFYSTDHRPTQWGKEESPEKKEKKEEKAEVKEK